MSSTETLLPALDTGIHISGNPEGETIVFFHSSLSTAGQWKSLIKSLQHKYLCVAIDALGYGKAPVRENLDGYHLLDEVERAANALQHANLPMNATNKVHLVGHSFGAAIAMRFASQYSSAIASLAIFEPVAFHLLDKADTGYLEVERVDETVFKSDAETAAKGFYEYWNGEGNFARLPAKIQVRFASLMATVTSDFHALMHCEKTLQDYQHFDFPKLLMFGEQTRHSAKQVVAALKGNWSNLTTVSVSGGHMSPVSTPEEVNPHILEFLTQQ